jgi:hypothetical protein
MLLAMLARPPHLCGFAAARCSADDDHIVASHCVKHLLAAAVRWQARTRAAH